MAQDNGKLIAIAGKVLPEVKFDLVEPFEGDPSQYVPLYHVVTGGLIDKQTHDRVFTIDADGNVKELALGDYYDWDVWSNWAHQGASYQPGKTLGDFVVNAEAVVIYRYRCNNIATQDGSWRSQGPEDHVAKVWTREE